MYQKLLDDVLKEMKEQGIVMNYFQVRKGGKNIVDWGRLNSKTRLNTWSVSKSFISIAVGMAMDRGLLTLDEKVCDSFKEYLPENPSENLTSITVRDMLTMTIGVESPLFFTDDPERYVTKDWLKYFFTRNFPNKPGENFMYCNFNTYVLACLVEKKVGVPMMDWLEENLFVPLGINSPDWTKCPMGHIHAANGLYLTIDEFSNFGEMILNKGVFNGKRIVSEEYINEATKNQMKEGTDVKYGYQFWINPDEKTARADGKFGQYIYVLDDIDTVVSVQSLDSGNVGGIIWDKFISKIK